MKKVLFIHSSSDMYGSDRALLNIAKYINKKKYEIFVLLPDNGPLVSELNKIPNVNVEIYPMAILRRKNKSFFGIINYLKELRLSYNLLKKYLKEKRIDAVYTNTAVVICGALAAKKMHVKSIWHIREIIKNKFENIVISFIVNCFSDLILVNSKATGEALKVSKKKIRVVYDAVEDKENTVIKKIDHQHFTVGMAGRINRWKGQKLFVDAAEIVHKNYPDVVFEIAGDAYKDEEFLRIDLQNYIEQKGLQKCIKMLGYIDDMDSFYNSLDLFVLPSIQPEPFGLVVIEAMEFELPVVATNHGGPNEIINNKKDGYLVDYRNGTEMADAIIELMKNEKLRKKIGVNGKKRKRNVFSIKAMVKATEMVLDEIK